MKRVIQICLIFLLSAGMVMPVMAAPTDTYTRSDVPGGNTTLQLSREMYTAECTIDAASLGLEKSLEGITDVYCADDGTIFLLCGGTSRLIRIREDYKLKDEMVVTDADGNAVDFTGAKGIYSGADGYIYLADTGHARILILDSQGKVIDTLDRPKSDLIPEDFMYQPVSVTKDKQGYTYILSLGCYYGALLYTPQNEFLAFYGANTVGSNALDTLAFLWEKLTSNDTKKAASTKKLPYSFVDFSFDPEGYMVTCTDNTEGNNTKSNGTGQIRKIAPNGENILYKKKLKGGAESSANVNFLEKEAVYLEETGNAVYRPQKLVSIAVSEDGYIYALDNTNGTIYIYDDECNLMSAFGGGLGTGTQKGTFKTPIALALSGMKLFVADYDNQNITVFGPTAYGMLFRNAQSAYLNGDYSEAKEAWHEVLAADRGNQLALRGLAMVCYNEGNYQDALDYSKRAYDYSIYDLAWHAVLAEWIADHFAWISVILVLAVMVIALAILRIKRRRGRLICNENVRVLLNIPFHPFQSFTDLKYKGKSSWPLAILLTTLFYVGAVLGNTSSGFLYKSTRIADYNALYTLAGTVGILVLWSACNWLVCSMLGGIGRFKEVYTATVYALLPTILYSFVSVVLSNFLPLSMSGIISGFGTAVALYSFFLLCVAMITVHDYDFFKVLWTAFISICMMILVVFVLLMCVILLMQFGTFVYSVYEEMVYR